MRDGFFAMRDLVFLTVGGLLNEMGRFKYKHPYAWRTRLRQRLPSPCYSWIAKGKDCEQVGAEHHWYNHDDARSSCYHCNVVRPGQLWRRDETDPN